jgi:hypothetical protein
MAINPDIVISAAGAAVTAIAAISAAFLAPALLASRTERMHREDREADYARQDEVARKAKEAADALMLQQKEAADAAAGLVRQVASQVATTADDLKIAQAETIRRTNEVALAAKEASDQAILKLDQIHTLVNSDMTAARQSELDQTRAMLVVLKRVVATAQGKHQEPEQADLDAIASTEGRIHELEQILADRLIQFRKAQTDIEAGAAAAAAAAAVPDPGTIAAGGGAVVTTTTTITTPAAPTGEDTAVTT